MLINKKTFFLVAILVGLSSNANAKTKKILVCISSFTVTTEQMTCYGNNRIVKTDLESLYTKGWRLIDVEVSTYRDNSKIVRDGAISHLMADGTHYYLEK